MIVRIAMKSSTEQTAEATAGHSKLRTQAPGALEEYYAGRKLWGDDFPIEDIREWYHLEENACFDIYDQGRKRMPNNDLLHWRYGYRWAVQGRGTLGKVLGLGSGNGEEFRPVRRWIEHLYIVESAQGYCQSSATTTYVKAREDGALEFPADMFDTAVAIAVLHHVPNVSFVMRELARVLKPGGCCLVKEPITSLGEWRGPRKAGLSPCERGIPRKWFDRLVTDAGFQIERKQYFEFPPIRRLRDQVGVDTWNSRFWVGLDRWFCRATLWNYRYHRTSFLSRLAPSYVFYVLRKPAAMKP
jgi:SAM-dependent methyltransferase